MSESPSRLPTFQAPLDSFYHYLNVERGLSLHTQRNYRQQLETMAFQLIELGHKTGNLLMQLG